MTNPRSVWVDADACPRAVREILFRAADRVGIPVTLVANQHIQTPRSPNVRSVQVPSGIDAADSHIAQSVNAGDLVVTQDIPLAAEVIEKGAIAIGPRGATYTPENIRERLRMRDFMDLLRGTGVATGGPPPFGKKDRAQFANAIDRWLAEPK
ncbi:MAG: YaiI/YqxD family protein [Pseudomonadota bacterium]